jgi:hypothetical protein
LLLIVWMVTLPLQAVTVARAAADSEAPAPAIGAGMKAPATGPLPFVTIAHGAPLGDTPVEPLYTAVPASQACRRLRGRLPDQALEAGTRLGVSGDNPLIVAFAGVKPSSGHAVTIERIVRKGDRLFVRVSHAAPGLNAIVEPAATLPYHLVRLPGEALPAAPALAFVFHDQRGNVLNHCTLTSGLTGN